MSGMEWVPYAASAAASAAGSIYSSNQANSTNAGNAYMANMTNMFLQAQNQDYNSAQAGLARDFNARESATQRSWSADMMHDSQRYATEMSNTSYQRAVKDMQAAGLNPMLAYSQGGASTPSVGSSGGSAASAGAASTGVGHGAVVPQVSRLPLDAIGAGAMDVMQKKAAIDRMNSETDLIKSQTNLTDLNAANADQEFNAIRAKVQNIYEDTRLKGIAGNKTQSESYVAEYVADKWHEMNDLQQKLMKGEIGQLQANTRAQSIRGDLMKLEIPGAQRQADVWSSDYGKFRAIIPDVGSVFSGASAFGNLLGRGSALGR